MNVTIEKTITGGTIEAIGSKSMAHRLLIASALTKLTGNKCHVAIEKLSDDIEATMECLSVLLGSSMGKVLNCRESGSTLRFLLPIAGALGIKCAFKLEGNLKNRPIKPLYDEMTKHGCKLSEPGQETIELSGRLKGGEYEVPGNISSQFITGLLMALPMARENSNLKIIGKMESASYVDMTLEVLKMAGIVIRKTPGGFMIPGGQKYYLKNNAHLEGDWSNAAFWISMTPYCKEDIIINGLDKESTQGDKEIERIMREMHLFGTEERIEIDVTNIPDLVPAIAVAAAGASGTVEIVNAQRLKYKESDRIAAVVSTINGLGGRAEETQGGLIIRGCGAAAGGRLEGGRVDSFGDHRIAMLAAGLSAIAKGPVTITGAEVVSKSYPGFFEDFEKLGGVVRKEI